MATRKISQSTINESRRRESNKTLDSRARHCEKMLENWEDSQLTEHGIKNTFDVLIRTLTELHKRLEPNSKNTDTQWFEFNAVDQRLDYAKSELDIFENGDDDRPRCEECDHPFEPQNKRQRFCSKACREQTEYWLNEEKNGPNL